MADGRKDAQEAGRARPSAGRHLRLSTRGRAALTSPRTASPLSRTSRRAMTAACSSESAVQERLGLPRPGPVDQTPSCRVHRPDLIDGSSRSRIDTDADRPDGWSKQAPLATSPRYRHQTSAAHGVPQATTPPRPTEARSTSPPKAGSAACRLRSLRDPVADAVGRTGAARERKTTPDAGRRWKASSQVRGRFRHLVGGHHPRGTRCRSSD